MRIVLISEVFSKSMGYLENLLPKYLVRQGAQVEVVASSLPPDFRNEVTTSSYRGFADDCPPDSYEMPDGFRLHVLPAAKQAGHIRLLGLRQKLKELEPDIVQTMTPIGWIAVDASLVRLTMGYRLFSGCHYHASVFPLAQEPRGRITIARMKCFLQRGVPGRISSLITEKYYAISQDCAEVAARFFGVPEQKIVIQPLGVDTELFHPVSSVAQESARAQLRKKYNFSEKDIVCVYTGRFAEDKNPLLLARAIATLAGDGYPFKGLFVGNGPQADQIEACTGCFRHPFVPVQELADLYRAADIGIWPTQESMSMLDAAACGLPVVANDKVQAPERLAGNGMTYRLLDQKDLENILLQLKDQNARKKLGVAGADKMSRHYSWHNIARERLTDYAAALSNAGVPQHEQNVRLS